MRAIAYGTDGALGYVIGAYAQQTGDADGGTFTLTLLKGNDGRWLIVSDMDRPYRALRDVRCGRLTAHRSPPVTMFDDGCAALDQALADSFP